MNGLTLVVLVAAGVLAVANWWSRWRDDPTVELVTKPAVTIALIVAALTIDADPSSARPWFVVGLVACLAGDVALLPAVNRFVVGLASFLVGHILLAVGAVEIGVEAGWAIGAGVVAAVMGVVLAPRIVRAAGSLAPAVAAYFVVIMAMAVCTAGTARAAGVIGAAAFVVSDSILGWDRFVGRLRWAPVAIMVTYHLALGGLVLTLI